MKTTLYAKDTKGNIKEWTVETIGAEIHVTHGRLGGKMQTKVTVATPKNVGRANETTAEEQAVFEATSKASKQYDKRYRPTIEELDDIKEDPLPMLAHDFLKVGHRMQFPCHVSPKLDGVRCLAIIENESVRFVSRGGKEYDVPPHLKESLLRIPMELGVDKLILDGELYIHGMALQDIVSCVKKENEDTQNLQYWVFDIPCEETPWLQRYEALEVIKDILIADGPLKIVENVLCFDGDQHLMDLHTEFENEGFEGIMLRDLNAVYQFNYRSSGLMKRKNFKDCEARVVNVTRDKNDEGVLECVLPNGVTFECKMRGTHDYRRYESMLSLVGAWINVKYQALTNDGAPQFPVGMYVRECDENGFPQV